MPDTLSLLEKPIDMEDGEFKRYYAMGKEDLPKLAALTARKSDLMGKVVANHCRKTASQAHPAVTQQSTDNTSDDSEDDCLKVSGKIPWDKLFKFIAWIAALLVIAAAGGTVLKEFTGGFVIVAGAEGANNTTSEAAGAAPGPNTDQVLSYAGWILVAVFLSYWLYTEYRKRRPKDLRQWASTILSSLEHVGENPYVRQRIDLFWDKSIKPTLNDLAKKVLGEGETLDNFRVQVAKWGAAPWDTPIPGYGDVTARDLLEESDKEEEPLALADGPPEKKGD